VDNLRTADSCPTCGRLYDGKSRYEVNARLPFHQEKLAEAETQHKECVRVWEYYNGERKKHANTISAAREVILQYQQQLNARQEYDRAKENLIAREEAASAKAQANLTEAENAENPHLAIALRIQAEHKQAEEALADVKQREETLSEEWGHLVHWRSIYGKEMKLKLFEDACPVLDDRTAYHLGRLNNPQIHCDFSTVKRLATGETKEEFDVTVWSETGGHGFVTGSTSDFLILDEPFTELCPKNAEAVSDYLTAEIEQGRDTILLISNDEALKGLIPDRIHVEKRSGVSNVVDN
jgi:DNA repair exonuclease SbcCD ATPase subunit